MMLLPELGGLQAAQLMHEFLLQRVLGAPMCFFDTIPLGRIISRFSKDIGTVDEDLMIYIQECIWLSFEVTCSLFILINEDLKFNQYFL